MNNLMKGWLNISLFLGLDAGKMRDALLSHQLPVLVMDGEFYASTAALMYWLEHGGRPGLCEPTPDRNAFVVNALERAKIATLESYGIRIRETA